MPVSVQKDEDSIVPLHPGEKSDLGVMVPAGEKPSMTASVCQNDLMMRAALKLRRLPGVFETAIGRLPRTTCDYRMSLFNFRFGP